jgi:hypothetical protein
MISLQSFSQKVLLPNLPTQNKVTGIKIGNFQAIIDNWNRQKLLAFKKLQNILNILIRKTLPDERYQQFLKIGGKKLEKTV